jgi:oligopeptidase B
MKSYAPYENVAEGASFPDIFATSGLNDPRVGYWEPAKWVQRIRARAGNEPLVLFRTNLGAGHAGAADRYEYLREAAHDWAFILERLGCHDRAPAS